MVISYIGNGAEGISIILKIREYFVNLNLHKLKILSQDRYLSVFIA